MHIAIPAALVLSLAAVPSPKPPDMTSVESAFRKSIGADIKISPFTFLELERYEIPGLSERLGLDAFVAKLRDPDGALLEELPFLFRAGEVRSLGLAFGGWGLMSAAVYGNCLYYTYSWGSGIHRTHVGRASLHPGELRLRESIGYQHVDLFVKASSEGVTIYEGEFISFNKWRGKPFLQEVDNLFTDAKMCAATIAN